MLPPLREPKTEPASEAPKRARRPSEAEWTEPWPDEGLHPFARSESPSAGLEPTVVVETPHSDSAVWFASESVPRFDNTVRPSSEKDSPWIRPSTSARATLSVLDHPPEPNPARDEVPTQVDLHILLLTRSNT